MLRGKTLIKLFSSNLLENNQKRHFYNMKNIRTYLRFNISVSLTGLKCLLVMAVIISAWQNLLPYTWFILSFADLDEPLCLFIMQQISHGENNANPICIYT